MIVRMKGLEPPRLTASDPKSDAATNYATPACCNSGGKYTKNCGNVKKEIAELSLIK